jgi:hypothetical protein
VVQVARVVHDQDGSATCKGKNSAFDHRSPKLLHRVEDEPGEIASTRVEHAKVRMQPLTLRAFQTRDMSVQYP